MANPRLSVEINRRRWYRNPNRNEGQPVYWSVTTVVKALPAPGLVHWAANSVAEYAVSHMQDWADLPAMEAAKKLARSPYDQRDQAGLRGTELHTIMERRMGGEDFALEASVDPTLAAAMAFVEEAKPEPEMVETSVFNEKHGYAGTFDFVGRLKAYPQLGRCMADWKQSKGIYRDMGAQQEAYNHADYWVDDDDQEHEWQPVDTLLLVHFTPAGYAIRPVPKGPGYFRAFLAALEVRRWEKWTPDIEEALAPPQPAPVDPAQLRFEEAALAAQVDWLRRCIKDLGPEVALELSAACVARGIPTKTSQLTVESADMLQNLVRLAEAGKL